MAPRNKVIFLPFWRVFSTRESSPTPQPLWSQGTSSTPSQNQGRPNTDDDIHREARAQEPINEETAVPLKDNNLFYKNGNPKPPPTGRLLIRGLTSKERKRPGGREKDRRRDRRLGSPAEVLKKLNPEIAERTNEVDDPIQTDGDASSEPPTQHLKSPRKWQRK